MSTRGWWAISGDAFIEALRRAHAGDDPELVYAEWYANSEVEDVGTCRAEEGRRLASEREDLIANGVDPALLAQPVACRCHECRDGDA